jgi:hypothetical protein
MPPRSAHRRGLPLSLSASSESIEDRIKRLRPNPSGIEPGAAEAPQSTQGVSTSVSASSSGNAVSYLRSDAPVVRNVRRGSAVGALDALADFGVQTLVEELVQDRSARSSSAAVASWLHTWERFHGAAFSQTSPAVPLVPVTVRGIVAVASLFKRGGYRSFANYATAIKSAHVGAGYEWDQLLSHTMTWCTRSVMRGVGPARQSQPFWFKGLLSLNRSPAPLVSGGPHGPIHMALLATMFLLREVEVSNSLISAWSFNVPELELTWHLPSSKSDSAALGTSRSWGCLCGLDSVCCPFHVALQHITWLKASPFFALDRDTPLFPAMGGGVPSKLLVVETFEAIGSLLGQDLQSPQGLRLFGGHTPRVTGAQLLGALGIDINKIRLLARHSGEAIMRYVAEAPLKSLRKDLGLLEAASSSTSGSGGGWGSASSSAAARARFSTIEAHLLRMDARLDLQSSELLMVASSFAVPDDRAFVQNNSTAAIHLAKPHDSGHTICGWKFVAARKRDGPAFRMVESLCGMPWHMLCERCLPTEREIARVASSNNELPLSEDE